MLRSRPYSSPSFVISAKLNNYRTNILAENTDLNQQRKCHFKGSGDETGLRVHINGFTQLEEGQAVWIHYRNAANLVYSLSTCRSGIRVTLLSYYATTILSIPKSLLLYLHLIPTVKRSRCLNIYIRLQVARSYTPSPDSPFSLISLLTHPTIFS